MRWTRPVAALGAVTLSGVLIGAFPLTPMARAGTNPPASVCPMFPADNVWNADISSLPVNAHSAQWLASTRASTTRLHPDFGPSFGAQPVPYGIPYVVTPASYPKVGVTFQYASESDPGPYPFGSDTPIEGGPSAGGDRHALMIDAATCTLYELFDARYSPAGSRAGSGALWDLRSNALRPAGWTSADAAGLPILPGLLRLDEVRSGAVTHAIRFTAALTDRSYLWPARHQAGSSSDPSRPPMGSRFRLAAGFATSGYLAQTQVVLQAMKHYGMILADNGSNWYFTGSADPGWDTAVLDQLKSIPASAFEAVDESSLMVDPNSAQVRAAPPPPVVGGTPPAVAGGPVGPGYRFVASDGGIFSFGGAAFFGSMGGTPLNSPIVGMAPRADGGGYWMVAADGGIFAFGDAPFHGSMGGTRLNSPIVGMAPTPGGGYWLTTSSGVVEAFGGAQALGPVGIALNSPVIAMAATPDGQGCWLLGSDGGVFSLGSAPFYGSTGSMRLNRPVVGMSATR
ncbi:MAG: hypothetical protein NVSMB32_14880 [Actinomycetota bacterium]